MIPAGGLGIFGIAMRWGEPRKSSAYRGCAGILRKRRHPLDWESGARSDTSR
jgi:hypothetical protein